MVGLVGFLGMEDKMNKLSYFLIKSSSISPFGDVSAQTVNSLISSYPGATLSEKVQAKMAVDAEARKTGGILTVANLVKVLLGVAGGYAIAKYLGIL